WAGESSTIDLIMVVAGPGSRDGRSGAWQRPPRSLPSANLRAAPMITAAITAVVGGVLAFFGVKPGPYLVVVAAAVKILIVVTTLVFGTRWVRRRDAAAAAKTE